MQLPTLDDYYKRIERDDIWCPGLKDRIVFNRSGFRHIIRKKGKLRTEEEQKRRFNLLSRVRAVIANPDNFFVEEKRKIVYPVVLHGRKMFTKRNARFWSCKEPSNGEITVIIRQVGGGNKHFFSVF